MIEKLWNQYQAKIYYINGKPLNQAQIEAKFKETASRWKTVFVASQQDQFALLQRGRE